MFRKKYKRLFPQTFSTKNIVAPYNSKKAYRIHGLQQDDKESDSIRKHESEIAVGLNELADFSSNNPDVHHLLLEAGQVLKETINAIGVSVYIVQEESGEMYLLTGQRMTVIPFHHRFVIGEGSTIAAHVAFNKRYVMVDDINQDPRFPQRCGIHNCQVGPVFCVPVVNPEGRSIAVFELMRSVHEEPFDIDDLKIVIVVSGWMGTAIHENLQRIAMKKQEILHNHLLNITTTFFKEQSSLSQMLSDLVALAKESMDVIRGSFYVVDKDKEDLTAHVFEENIDGCSNHLIRKNIPIEPIKKDRGIVSIVARSGYTINVKDPSRDPRIGKEPELKTGRTIKSMLCMPILSNTGLLGIFKLLNKRTGYFNRKDESILKIFGSYASCCLHYNIMSERLKKMVLIGNIYERCLDLELKPCDHERFTPKNVVVLPSNFLDFRWYDPDIIMNEAPELVVYMIRDLCGDDDINYNNLADFALVTRRLYRNNPYHNFEHAFNFMHCMYNILKRNLHLFSLIEIKALLIASICHDIDHGGCTNNFLIFTNDVIHQLYEESPWENYHYFVTTKLLQKYDIFKFNDINMKIFMKEIKEAIIATDLQEHFRNRKILFSLISDQSFQISNNAHKTLLKGLMMTICDLSGQCKPFQVAKRITDNVYREFYNQGDHEKQLKIIPLSMMDREKMDQLEQDQIHFISVIVSPATEMLSVLMPNTIELNAECRILQSTWQEIMDSREKNTEFIR